MTINTQYVLAWIAITVLSMTTVSIGYADNTVFCPQKNNYISIGMTPQQVLANCGEPQSKQTSNTPVMVKVAVQQLIFNNQGTDRGFYGVWSMPISNNASGNGGSRLMVNIIDNKIDSINLNGSNSNAFSLCGNRSIQVGDPASVVQMACGSPRQINQTFVMKPIMSRTKPEIWTYQQSSYLPSMTLTFVDGKLQSISSGSN